MEDVLQVYARPYDPKRPVVCMDETNKPLTGEVRKPLPAQAGQVRKIEHEYVRNGVAQIFLEVEPLNGPRHVEVGERRTRKDWARFIRDMLEERYPVAERVVLVMDNIKHPRDRVAVRDLRAEAGTGAGRAPGNPLHA